MSCAPPRAGHTVDIREQSGQPHEVVDQGGARQPRGLGEEVPRGYVLETCPFLQVPDGQFHRGMGAVEGVEPVLAAFEIGDEGEVAPQKVPRWGWAEAASNSSRFEQRMHIPRMHVHRLVLPLGGSRLSEVRLRTWRTIVLEGRKHYQQTQLSGAPRGGVAGFRAASTPSSAGSVLSIFVFLVTDTPGYGEALRPGTSCSWWR